MSGLGDLAAAIIDVMWAAVNALTADVRDAIVSGAACTYDS